MAYDIFLQTDPQLKGESTDADHQDWIKVLSFNWGAAIPGARPGIDIVSVTKPRFSAFEIVKNIDRASPGIMTACAKSTFFKECTVEVQRTQGTNQPEVVYALIFRECFIASAHTAVGEQFLEAVTFIFSRMEIGYLYAGTNGQRVTMVKAYNLENDKTYTPADFPDL
jgi:type VI secretion system secreted protein Hcp